jgi:hypothetical protein
MASAWDELSTGWKVFLGGVVVVGGLNLYQDHVEGQNEPSPSPTYNFTPSLTPSYDYTPSYSSYDLDCVDFGSEFYVGAYDPHNLDADNDGWACEGW